MLSPVLKLGPLQLHWYGLLIAAAIWCSLLWVEKRAVKRGLSQEAVWASALWVLVGGLVGGRAYHVVHYWGYYSGNISSSLAIWQGGMGIFGAIFGGWVTFTIYWFWKSRLAEVRPHESHERSDLYSGYFQWLDLVAPALLLGQAIGRWGNFFNYELYGWPTSKFWGFYVPPQYRFWEVAAFETFHPIFLYESVWCLFALGMLLEVERRCKQKLVDGDLFLLYLILYALGRAYLESLRIESWTIADWRLAQLLSLLVVIGATLALILRRKPFKGVFIKLRKPQIL